MGGNKRPIISNTDSNKTNSPFVHRALPPLPPKNGLLVVNQGDDDQDNDHDAGHDEERRNEQQERQKILDYAASIEKVKDVSND